MEETLELSLTRIFGGAQLAREIEPAPRKASQNDDRSLKALIEQASNHYSRAQLALKQGNWTGYGEEIKRLEGVLKELKEKSQ